MVVMNVVEVSIMQIVDMISMLDGCVSTIWTVGMRVVVVMIALIF